MVVKAIVKALAAVLASTLSLLWAAVRVFISFCVVLVGSAIRALRRQRIPIVDRKELDLPFLAARLSDLPYHVETADELKEGLAKILDESELLYFAEQEFMHTNACWYIAKGKHPTVCPEARSTFLVFRGTMSPTDAIADVLFRPEAGPNGTKCHGGFLKTIKDDSVLHAQLAMQLIGTSADAMQKLYVMGHSLGGALSMTLVGAGFLPASYKGELTVVNLGGPATFYKGVDPSALGPAASSCRALTIVNGNDIVPRLLGSPLSFSRQMLEAFASSSSPKKLHANRLILDTLERYMHLPQTELLFVHEGKVQRVPYKDRHLVLHLAEAIHPRAIADHLAYVDGLAKATGL